MALFLVHLSHFDSDSLHMIWWKVSFPRHDFLCWLPCVAIHCLFTADVI